METINHIIKKARVGEEKAQRKLYEMYRSRWYMISKRYGKNKTQADDIFQEGMIQIFKDLKQFDETKSQFSTWSSRVLVNAALRYLKKENWINAVSDLDAVAEPIDQNVTIYQQLARKELTDIVQRLPMGYRIVFNMNVIEGYTHKEIAKSLGITEGTSKSQLSKARKALKRHLETFLITSSHE